MTEHPLERPPECPPVRSADSRNSTPLTPPLALAAILYLSGCWAHEKPVNELLANGDFNVGSQLWRSVNTINAQGVFSTWRPNAGREKTGAVEISVDHDATSATPTWTCEILAAPRGRSVVVTGYVRGFAVTGSPGLYARAWSVGRASILAEVNTELTQLPVGNFDWTPLVAVLAVPSDAVTLELQLFLRGPGTAWFDDLSVRVDPETTLDPEEHD